jgi:histidinol-phosphate aminotransferase
MFELEKLIRPNILSLKPYSSARDEYSANEGIFLDANENPFGYYNRYPDPYQKTLKEKLSLLKNVPVENIFIGNGSDEVIDLTFRIFCNPGIDKVVIFPPTYGMYEVLAKINNVEVISIPLDENFQINLDQYLSNKELLSTAKILFLCSPNNPTGNSLENIETIIQNFNGIVFLDEAYIDFSSQKSFISKINVYPNLIVSQTFSKAWGKAAIRVGIAYANKEIISYYNKVKPPYNVSVLNQVEAIKALSRYDIFEKNLKIILEQRKWLIDQLSKLNFILHIYPTDANFVLVKTKDANYIYNKLIENKIIVRNRHTVIDNCIRITIGQPEENEKLIEVLKNIKL